MMSTMLAEEASLAGRYVFRQELGRGAHGRVILAADAAAGSSGPSTYPLRAIKVVAAEHAERLQWEFALLSRISHPGVARVFELLRVDQAIPGFDLAPGAVALVEEFAPGNPLDRAAKKLAGEAQRLLELALTVGEAVARALSAIHAQGLVHGDVKPANVVVGEDLSSCKLIDLGLAEAPGVGRNPRGTPGFMAPEAWLGEKSPASDIYGLGASLAFVLRGAPDQLQVRSVSASEHLAKALAPPREWMQLPEWVPESVRNLACAMLEPDPSARLCSAREVAARLAAARSHVLDGAGEKRKGTQRQQVGGGADDVPTAAERSWSVSALPFRGNREPLRALTEALSDRSVGRPAVLVVWGPAGAGRSRMVREAVRGVQAACVAALQPVATYRYAFGLPEKTVGHDCILHVADGEAASVHSASALVRAAAIEGNRLTVVVERRNPSDAPVPHFELKPLDRGAVEQLVKAALTLSGVPDALLEAAMTASGGLAGRLCRLMAQGLGADMDMSRPANLRELAAAREPGGFAVGETERLVAEIVGCAGGALPLSRLTQYVQDPIGVAQGAQALLASGLASENALGLLVLRPDVRASLTPGPKTLAVAERLLNEPLSHFAVGCLNAALGRAEPARLAFLKSVAQCRARGEPESAAQMAADSMRQLGSIKGIEHLRWARADALRACGRYREAEETLRGDNSSKAVLLRAELLRLRGDLTASEREAQTALQARGTDEAMGPALQAVMARVALDRNQLAEAGRLALQIAAGEGDNAKQARMRAHEVLALTFLYQGHMSQALEQAQKALATARASEESGLEARAMSVMASVALAHGKTHEAANRFARAFELAERAGESHMAATFLVNVGLSRLDCGELGPAVAALREGARRLARLEREADLARSLYNLGNAANLIGDDDLALSSLQQARQAADVCGDPWVKAYAQVVQAEVQARRGEHIHLRNSLCELGRTVAKGATAGVLGAADRAVLQARCAVLWLALQEARTAEQCLAEAAQSGDKAQSHAARIECQVAAVRLALHLGDSARAQGAGDAAHGLANRSGAFEARLRATLAAAEAAESAGQSAVAAARFAELRSMLDSAAKTLTPPQRARLRNVDAYRRALQAMPAGLGAETEPAPATDTRWRKLAAVTQRLTAERRVPRLYQLLLDAAIELTGAERGFVLVRDNAGNQRVRAARGLDQSDLEGDQLSLSRSVVARVIAEARPLATVDALTDERLDGAASVHALALRSVLAVPLRLRAEVRGAIYLDDRLRPFAFGEQETALLSNLSELASIALDGAELLRSERRSARHLEVLRARLAQRVEEQALELAAVKGASLTPGAEFPEIAGDSAAMRQVLQMVGRVAKSDLPVLILGESGTGKELIASAIHKTSLRAKAPFVTENCSAIPEQLLESALFGHVRGAFTGADRRRLGLFEVADGGTLLLDEIGEMSPAMQARLLRVLEAGEIRPLGGERTRKVDVRVVAATHRDLASMVQEGRFRQDLYYRLAVFTIEIPPLRSRPEDIPALVAHFVSKHTPDRERHRTAGHEQQGNLRIDKRALAALTEFPWPGNVRQLENEIRRALLLADDLIKEEHLSFARNALQGATGPPPDEFDLKAQVQALEQRLIQKALKASNGNQTKAAKLLGVSRFGLQKMIKRLAT